MKTKRTKTHRRGIEGVRLQIEPLEDRRVLATVLEGITTNEGNLLDLTSVDTLQTSPSELTLVFRPGDVLSPADLNAIELVRGGPDQTLGTEDDVTVGIGSVGLGDTDNKAVVRFAETLPNDNFEIRVSAPALPTTTNVRFNIDLGARVIGVVPQPTMRMAHGSLSQQRDKIVVYFNNDDLNTAAAENPAFYQLIFTGHSNTFDSTVDTVNNLDDGTAILPTTVAYDAGSDTATLTFSADIEDLAGGAGTYRLRIGTNEAMPMPTVVVDPTADGNDAEAGQTVVDANSALGTLNDQSKTISGVIGSFTFGDGVMLTPAGGENDPGHRIAFGQDRHVRFPIDSVGIEEFSYNFGATYRNPTMDGDPPALLNQITEAQKDLARQVFDLYSYYLGIEFVETESDGFIVATGSETANDAVVIVGSNFDESYGGDWFQQAMFQIGFGIGLGLAEDLPEGTIMGGPDGAFLGGIEDAFSADQRLTFGREAEAVFPGDHDIVHGQYLYNTTADDVDMYQFTLTEPGVVSLETFAERRTDASTLDTVVRLFDSASEPNLIAQNDDYFGSDSLVEVELQPGSYYVGVSSAGNDEYDAAFPTFTGGRSSGEYDLRVDFRSTADNSIVDATGRRLDGDADGIAGGVHNFWFRAQSEANTIFVDKAATGTGDGTISSPYNNLRTAMDASSEGDIVRVVGNNFGDGNDTNDLPYEIGLGSSGSLPDGGADGLLRIRKGVTLMIDAGAVFKMRRGAIVAGSDSPLIDNSGGAIQILGTPNQPVIFTSLNDEAIGADNNPTVPTTPALGDWGGIIIRNDAARAAGQFDYESQGIFLNYVNHADMRYGGGILTLNSVPRAINAVTLIDARPTVTNNSITQSMDAPLAVSPNSFEETNFRAPEFQSVAFTPDYTRIGPDIHGNVLLDNEINGLSVANRGISFNSTLTMSVSGRFDDTDIVHVISDNLTIADNPGGVVTTDGVGHGRGEGRLAIDPGTVVKLDGGMIEVGFGATLLAEGTTDKPVVFTSVFDARFGGGGTFATDTRSNSPQAGDWGGLFLNPTSRGSFDYNVIAYGGGEAPIEGSLAGFNVIEVYQADARVTNSTLEFNADGQSVIDVGNRRGRGSNAPSTIFVRGAQPIVVGNYFHDNDAAVVNINVNSLNYFNVQDFGRQTGSANPITGYLDNQGPLVRDNVMDRNGINGMEVRGGTLTTESIWDDTDIVHVVRDGIYVTNFHSFGGLRLKSSQTESLVVKLNGDAAGFVTTGSAIGIPDHIGGSIQVLGQPGRPVVLTSLFDDSVGAGVDSRGATQADTNNGGRPLRTIPLRTESSPNGFEIDVNFGPNIREFPEVMDAVQNAVDVWEEQFQDDIRIVIDVDTGLVQSFDVDGNPSAAGDGLEGFPGASTLSDPTTFNFDARLFDTTAIRDGSQGTSAVLGALISDAGSHEEVVQQLPSTAESLNVTYPNNSAVPFATADTMRLTTANAKALGLSSGISIPSAFDNSEMAIDGTIIVNQDLDLFDFDRSNGILTYREDFQSQFMREIGEILGFDSSIGFVNGFLNNPVEPDPTIMDQTQDIFLSPLDLFRFAPGDAASDFTNAPRLLDPQLDEHVIYAGGDLNFQHWPFEAITPGEIPIDFDNWQDEYFNRDGELRIFEPIGVMDPFSVLRDGVLRTHDSLQSTQGIVIELSEADRLAFDSIGYDVVGPTAGAWDGITLHQLTYDGNVEYVLESEVPTGLGSGTNSTPSTAQSLGSLAPDLESGNEVRRLGFEVHGLVRNDSDVDVYSFTGVAGTDVWIDIDQTSATFDSVVELVDFNGTVLASSDDSARETAGLETAGGIGNTLGSPDIYTSNIHDAGMSLTLPGPSGFEGTYFVVVHSFDDSETPSVGDSKGRYELQVRLKPTDVVPGTTVQYADIRYAENGVEIVGPPSDSPLLGEHSEDESLNDYFEESIVFPITEEGFVVAADSPLNTEYPYEVSAQKIGNLLTSRQGAISVAGIIEGNDDVDWYEFEIASYDYTEGLLGGQSTTAQVDVIFDIDYADGLGRPNTAISVYREGGLGFGIDAPQLIYYGESSSLIGDQTASSSDLSGGSYGPNDPYIGPVSIGYDNDFQNFGFGGFGGFGGFNLNTKYYVAVSPIGLVPDVIADDTAVRTPVTGIEDDFNRGWAVQASDQIDFLNATKPRFVTNPDAPAGANNRGAYQLEIRVADPDVGDENRERLQGQIVIANNFISNSQEFGVSIVDGLRDLPSYGGAIGEDVPRPREILENDLESPQLFGGSIRQQHGQFSSGDYKPTSGVPRALPNENEQRVIPGLTVSNNVISGGFDGGIEIKGDAGGVVLNTYNLSLLFDLYDDADCGHAENAEFTIWDHQGNTQTFDFIMGDGQSEPGKIPIRYDCSLPETPNPASDGTAQVVTSPPTLTDDLRAEIEHALRLSDLDIKIHKVVADAQFITVPTSADDTEDIEFDGSATFFIEGARKIGLVDVAGFHDSPFIPGDLGPGFLPLPMMTAFVAQQGSVPYARVVNNTLVGRGGDLFDGNGVGDVGILVEDNASPTLLNNIVSNFAVGIQSDESADDSGRERFSFIGNDFPIDQSAFGITGFMENDNEIRDNAGQGLLAAGIGQLAERNIDEDFLSAFPIGGARPTIVAATVYQGNRNDTLRINEGSNRIQLTNDAPLFVDPANGNYFLAAGSAALNSSTSFLNERGYLAEVQSTVGLTPTQIQAPRTDALGILREDGFADRGALERADLVGPTAQLVNPTASADDPTVAVIDTSLSNFTVQLQDGFSQADPVFGSGVDDNTVDVTAVTLLRDGIALIDGQDYILNYNPVNDSLRFSPPTGVWPTNSTYTIILDNTLIMDRAANRLQANQFDGTTQFTIQTGAGLDYGDAPAPYPTSRLDDGARHGIGSLFLGDGVDFDSDGTPNDAFDDGVLFQSSIVAGNVLTLSVAASEAGVLNAWIDFNANGSWADAGEQIFTNRPVVAGGNTLAIPVPESAELGDIWARFRLSSQTNLTPTGEAIDGEVEDYQVTVGVNPWTNPNDNFDVDADTVVNAVDALLVINELNVPTVRDPITGQLPLDIEPDGVFFDVNGDGFVSPIDALLVINRLNEASSSNLIAPLSSRTVIFESDEMEDVLDDLADDVAAVWGGLQ